MSRRSLPLLVVLGGALVVTGVLSSTSTSPNPSVLPNGLVVSNQAESTALYCTGLSSARGGVAGHVTYLNTTRSARDVSVTVVSDTAQSSTTSLRIAPGASASIDPASRLAGNSFAVAAQVNGGGVVGAETTLSKRGQTPCVSTGVTQWYGAGFDTTVGSRAVLSIYNPTATPAVFDVSTNSALGFVAPARYQGFAVGAHAQVEIDLGKAIVNTSDIGVHVRVLRGALDIVGVQQSGATASLNAGVSAPTTSAYFPRVTTANRADAQIRVANPGPRYANITVSVGLAQFKVPDQTVRVAPYSSATLTITPNPAIPIAGYATIHLRSSEPVISALATGTGSQVALSSPVTPGRLFLISDFTGQGFDAAALTNTSAKTLRVTLTTVVNGASQSLFGVAAQLAPGTTTEITSLGVGLTSLRGYALLVSAPREALVVTLTLPTSPKGMTVVSPLDGR